MSSLWNDNPIALVIIGCEVGFWILLVIGLALRYLARRPRAGAIVLLLIPVVDLILLGAAALDLHQGAEPGWGHSVAAIYLGVSVAFGHRMVSWADGHFAHRFAGGPKPVKPPKYGRAKAIREWQDFGRLLVAVGITIGCTLVLKGAAATPEQAAALTIPNIWTVVLIWFLVGPGYATATAMRGDDGDRPRRPTVGSPPAGAAHFDDAGSAPNDSNSSTRSASVSARSNNSADPTPRSGW